MGLLPTHVALRRTRPTLEPLHVQRYSLSSRCADRALLSIQSDLSAGPCTCKFGVERDHPLLYRRDNLLLLPVLFAMK